jgi:hypothetical protein
MPKVKYIGNMGSGMINTRGGAVFCKRNEVVEVSKNQLEKIVRAKDWVQVLKEDIKPIKKRKKL